MSGSIDVRSAPVLSILDLCPIPAGSSAATAFSNSVDLARHAERLGYRRYWIAEHHSIPGVASAATSVVIGHIAGATRSIRVGSGGIMLPNHAPLVIAEQFGTLESLYPGRIDLGIGRAPGGDQATARALRRTLTQLGGGDPFPADLAELRSYFKTSVSGQAVRAIPGEGLNIPFYILGSSDYGANLAAELGLPFAFASHFAPDYLHTALALYRSRFEPSAQLEKPYVMIGVNVFAADTDAEARRLFTSLQQAFVGMTRRQRGELPPPVDSMDGLWNPLEQGHVQKMLKVSVVGSEQTVREGFHRLAEETQADELITTAMIYDHAARVRSAEIAARSLDLISA
jgi:luciferase family oxidoreductase group 1